MSTRLNHLDESEWPAQRGHVPSLDGLRALSVLAVLVGHMLLPSSLVGVSALGLKTFFLISGFLITRLLFAEAKKSGRIDLRAFYVRRILRLYPVIVVYVALSISVVLWRGGHVAPIDIASVFLYFVNYLVVYYDQIGVQMSLPVSMLWSLSVEEHFYLMFPVLLVMMQRSAQKMIVFAIFICALSLILRFSYVSENPEIVNTLHIYWRSETRFDCIAFGVLLACLSEIGYGRSIIKFFCKPFVFGTACVLLLCSFLIRDNYFQMTTRFTIQSLALMPIFAGVIFGNPFNLLNNILNTKILKWIGMLSYSLYVWHGGVMFLFGQWLHKLPKGWDSAAEFCCAFLLATASYFLLEKPVLQWRNRWERNKSLNNRQQTRIGLRKWRKNNEA